jgi:DNA topoisomerase-1
MQVYSDPDEERRQKEADKRKSSAAGKGKEGEDDRDDHDDGKEKEFESPLPDGIAKGNPLKLEKIETKQSFTKPPLRYTESLLVRELEAKGIGRPSTYAAIITTIQDRGYVEQRERKLYATELGIKVSDMLVANFPALFDVKFTSKMEGDLDTIASGEVTYLNVMERFYRPLQSSLRQVSAGGGGSPALKTRRVGEITGGAAPEIDGEKARRRPKIAGTRTEQKCGKCGSPMELRKGNYGHYLACMGFPACRNIISCNEKGVPVERRDSAAPQQPEEGVPPCEKCGSPMARRRGSKGEFYGCTDYPNCRHTRPIPLDITCPACGQGALVERTGGRFNALFYACTRYPECRFTSSLKPINRPCAKCGNNWLVNAWNKDEGEYVECPKCRERDKV